MLSRSQLHYAIYTTLAYVVAIIFSFLMNAFFTFRKSGFFRVKMFLRFVLVTVSLLVLVQGIQAGLIEVMRIKELFAIIVGMLFYTGTGYVLNRLWVFRERRVNER